MTLILTATISALVSALLTARHLRGMVEAVIDGQTVTMTLAEWQAREEEQL